MELNNLIESLFQVDQEIRKNPKFPMGLIEKTDNYTTEVLKQIIELGGIPLIDKVGIDVSRKFIMMVQHSRDLEFAQDVCDKLQNESVDNVPKTIMPYLIDKLLVARGEKQKFGTILTAGKDENNDPISIPKPIEDELNVNGRRALYGLEPIEDYLKTATENFKKFSRELNIKK